MEYLENLSRRERRSWRSSIVVDRPQPRRSRKSCPTGSVTRLSAPSCESWKARASWDTKSARRSMSIIRRSQKNKAERQACQDMLATFFGGSVEQATAALLDLRRESLTEEELDRLANLIERARKEGR